MTVFVRYLQTAPVHGLPGGASVEGKLEWQLAMWPENLVLELPGVRKLAYRESFQEFRFAPRSLQSEIKMNTYIMWDVVFCG